ncbi:MAG: ferrous iron transport protein B [Lachnospiraceae bacterium]|jgi:ferrous iron transport protein B|nr:ferrous iron transport protein B [Lachnospiraceae bacterium]
MSEYYCLNDMKPGQTAQIQALISDGSARRRLLDLGLVENTPVRCVGKSPSGDPSAFLIRGAVIAIRAFEGAQIQITEPRSYQKLIAFAGNPNVGKSTLFNGLTGMKQHTGNWPGKTVEHALGTCRSKRHTYILADLPGTYSLMAHSPEEEAARDFLCSGKADAAVVVCDASCLERNLNLALQTIELFPKVIVCVNLMDEAAKRHIQIDLPALSQALGVPVIGTTARNRKSLDALLDALDSLTESADMPPANPIPYPALLEAALTILEPAVRGQSGSTFPPRWLSLRLLEHKMSPKLPIPAVIPDNLFSNPSVRKALEESEQILNAAGIYKDSLSDLIITALFQHAEAICQAVVSKKNTNHRLNREKVDAFLTSRNTAYPVMLLLLAFVFWLTLIGANYPSRLLSGLFLSLEEQINSLLVWLRTPLWLQSLLVSGSYRVAAWVVSVMLPPMAIFFPLFTLLEDAGFLPRIAYNLDHAFQRCRSCGKQGLTLCMGFGCNAAGVTGCRIIDSPRERLIAILTNSFVPCNGRFPAIIALITMFFAGTASGFSSNALSAFLLTCVVVLGIAMTFLASWLLSRTVLKGLPSSFTLELPPYRRPQFGRVLIRSLLDRTLFVLGRAVTAAAPAGILIWIMANISLRESTLLTLCASALDPFASLFGLDGVILMAFLLGIPANEIVLPIILMTYLNQGSLTEPGSLLTLKALLISQGWTGVTAACTILFTLLHWPCATTLLTIYKETGSRKWTLLAFLLPTAFGLTLCFLTAQAAALFFG